MRPLISSFFYPLQTRKDQPDNRETINILNDNLDQFNPDVAYDHRNADYYVVYSSVDDADAYDVYLKYKRFFRNYGIISNEYLAQTDDHNGYDPSIDIGEVTCGATYTWVAIAYTAQFDNGHNGYHVNVTCWRPGPTDCDRATVFSVRHPLHKGQDAGLPCLDIAPDSNAYHVGVLVYTQVIDTDGYGAKTENYVVRFLGDLADLNGFYAIENDEDEFDTLYPSISVNSQTDSNIYVSLAYMGQDNDFGLTDYWHPMVASMKIYPAVLVDWSDSADPSGDYNTIIGNYNLSDIPFQNPGVASAIMTTNADMFWAAWNDRIEMEPPPTEVWASYGFAGD